MILLSSILSRQVDCHNESRIILSRRVDCHNESLIIHSPRGECHNESRIIHSPGGECHNESLIILSERSDCHNESLIILSERSECHNESLIILSERSESIIQFLIKPFDFHRLSSLRRYATCIVVCKRPPIYPSLKTRGGEDVATRLTLGSERLYAVQNPAKQLFNDGFFSIRLCFMLFRESAFSAKPA
jgi:hypothetical protein